MTQLRGMTWNHPRGIDPLVDCAKEYASRYPVQVSWEARSLEDFEMYPLEQLAAEFDLLVIDHPHVGAAAGQGVLAPFRTNSHVTAGMTVGSSHESYFYDGKQWALAIDAAAQVACRRAGTPGAWPRRWEDVMALARRGKVLWPLAPVHALMSFYTLCANVGKPCATSGDRLVDRAAADVLAAMQQLAALVPTDCHKMNPIAIYERLILNAKFEYIPLTYGYVSYARDAFRSARLEFDNIPGFQGELCRGSTLGGTGIAVSGRSKYIDKAAEFANFVASRDVQRGIYARAGQPAHRSAWLDEGINRDCHDFYRNTIATLDAAYLRPRFGGYIGFQKRAGDLVSSCLKRETSIDQTVRELNAAFAAAQKG